MQINFHSLWSYLLTTHCSFFTNTSLGNLDVISLMLNGFPVAQLVEHGVSNAKIMGSIPRESKSWQNVETVTRMQCKSLWIKASAKCVNVNVMHFML